MIKSDAGEFFLILEDSLGQTFALEGETQGNELLAIITNSHKQSHYWISKEDAIAMIERLNEVFKL